jgi:hypothetical protein
MSDARTKIAEGVNRDIAEITDNLIATAKGATKEHWVTCTKCHKRTTVQIPDTANAVKAAQLLMDQGFGRPAQESSASNSIKELVARAEEGWLGRLHELTNEELAAYIQFINERDPVAAREADEALETFKKSHRVNAKPLMPRKRPKKRSPVEEMEELTHSTEPLSMNGGQE